MCKFFFARVWLMFFLISATLPSCIEKSKFGETSQGASSSSSSSEGGSEGGEEGGESGTLDLSINFDQFTPISPTAEVNINVSGSGGTDVATVEIYSDACLSKIGDAAVDENGLFNIDITLSLTNAQNTIYAKGFASDDTEGDCTTLDTILHDATAPSTVGLTITIPANSTSTTQTPAFSWSVATDTGSGIKEYRYAIGTAAQGIDILNWTSTTQTQAPSINATLTDGNTYHVSVVAVDNADNISSVVSEVWEVDVAAATNLTIAGPVQNQLISSYKFNLFGACEVSGAHPITFSNLSSDLTFASNGTCTSSTYSTQGSISTSALPDTLELTANQTGQTSVNRDINYQPPFRVGSGFDNIVYAVAYTSESNNADIYVGGNFTVYDGVEINRLVRLNYDGTMDNGFSTENGFNGAVYAILPVEESGSHYVYVGGAFTTYKGVTSKGLVKLDSNGDIVSAFNVGSGTNDGFRFHNGSALVSGSVHALVKAKDGTGDILVGGQFDRYKSASINQKFYTRLNASTGEINTTTHPASFTSLNGIVYDIAPSTTGDVYIGGAFTTHGSTTVNRFARITNTGALSGSFTVQGATSLGFNNSVYTVKLVEADNKLYVGGVFSKYGDDSSYVGLVRITTSGVRDSTFNCPRYYDGAITTAGSIYDLEFASDGDLLVGGKFNYINSTSTAGYKIDKLNVTDGSRDSSFLASSGSAFSNTAAYYVYDIAVNNTLAPNNFISVGNFLTYQNLSFQYLARIRLDASPDIGTIEYGGPNSAGEIRFIKPLNDNSGRTYVGGDFTSWDGTNVNYLVRLNADGTRDTTFNAGQTGFTGGTGVNDLIFDKDNDGTIYVVGSFTAYNGQSIGRIVKLNSTGSLDSTFRANITSGANIGFGDGTALSIIQRSSDGRLFIGGSFTRFKSSTANHNYLISIEETGNLPLAGEIPTFNGTSNPNNSVYALELTVDESKLFVGGNFTQMNGVNHGKIALLTISDGSENSSTFDVSTGFTLNSGGTSDVRFIKKISTASDTVYVGGNFDRYIGSVIPKRLVTLEIDGDIGTFNSAGSGFDAGYVLGMIRDFESGQHIFYGTFGTYNTATVNGIAKISSTGVLDTTFISGERNYTTLTDVKGINFMQTVGTRTVNAAAKSTDGSDRIWAGGRFIRYGGALRENFIRLRENGLLD